MQDATSYVLLSLSLFIFRLKSFVSLKLHIETLHVRKFQQICDECGKVCQTKAILRGHMRSHDTRDTRTQCRLCPAMLKNERALKEHVHRIHESGPVNCPNCPKVSPNRSALAMHIRTRHNYKVHKCHMCDRECKSAVALTVRESRSRYPYTLFE